MMKHHPVTGTRCLCQTKPKEAKDRGLDKLHIILQYESTMKYRIKFKGGVQEYVVETVECFNTVRDFVQVMRMNFGFKEELLVYDENGTKLHEKGDALDGRTFTVRRVLKNVVYKRKKYWYR